MYKIANTNVPESDALSAVQLRVAKLEKDVSELKKIDHSAKALTTLKSRLQQLTLNKNLRKVLQRFSRLRRNKLRSKRCQSILLSLQTRQLSKSMIRKDENAMDEGVANTVKDQKRKHDDDDDDDDEDPLAGPKQ
ncbi:hypothetical protein Tco_1325777, partial [Tanacetum coccineum]